MTQRDGTRVLGELTFQDAARAITKSSILCWPLGAMEQHGPHLPLNTDTIIAEAVSRRIVERYGDDFDLWQLPAMPIGLSREHAWAPGTLSLSVAGMTALFRDTVRDLARALPARNLVIVNGHGGNRGILDALIYEVEQEFGFNTCVVHPLVLSGMEEECAFPDIHGGMIETSLMLVFAPQLVRKDRLASLSGHPDLTAIEASILDRGVSWPWNSGDPRLADQGITGDAHAASAELGEKTMARLLENVRPVLQRLRERGGR
jgi:creatinine amidohydrolase/Fe(II)-dependent formamide hydrolase-like protein